jgi:hypothetical protein
MILEYFCVGSEEINVVIFRVYKFGTFFFYLAIYVVMFCILATRSSHKRTLLFLPSSYWHLTELPCFLYNRSTGFDPINDYYWLLLQTFC